MAETSGGQKAAQSKAVLCKATAPSGVATASQIDVLASAHIAAAQIGDGAHPPNLYASYIGARGSEPPVNDNAHSGLQQVMPTALKGIVHSVLTKANVHPVVSRPNEDISKLPSLEASPNAKVSQLSSLEEGTSKNLLLQNVINDPQDNHDATHSLQAKAPSPSDPIVVENESHYQQGVQATTNAEKGRQWQQETVLDSSKQLRASSSTTQNARMSVLSLP
ncbi:hypothetical protein F0562_029662 [Nyssa sinensis]|uniref:Uncharacterized protein n=1 Tax=Nyssa sinensis TaxID=561372 RepID=A0A5J5B4P4_9ASTE|nr:hypothetical protein F0562_029662 [Nyssa sinensis]